jgi:hypothetical protein
MHRSLRIKLRIAVFLLYSKTLDGKAYNENALIIRINATNFYLVYLNIPMIYLCLQNLCESFSNETSSSWLL